ncbi:unnamed protein product, partial [marine sediment metagenome]
MSMRMSFGMKVCVVGIVGLLAAGTALGQDRSIVAWGRNNHGQLNVPAPNTDFLAVAAGDYHSLG